MLPLAVTDQGAPAATDAIYPASEVAPDTAAADVMAAAVSAARGAVVNQTQLAKIIGVTDVTLWDWQKQGLPILVRGERGQSNLYDTAAVFTWKIDLEVKKASGPESQKDRLTRLQADKLEMEIAVDRQELVPVALIEPAWISIVNAVRQALLPLGIRLAQILDSTPGVDAKREIIDEEVHEILLKLSSHDDQSVGASPDSQGNELLRPAAENPA